MEKLPTDLNKLILNNIKYRKLIDTIVANKNYNTREKRDNLSISQYLTERIKSDFLEHGKSEEELEKEEPEEEEPGITFMDSALTLGMDPLDIYEFFTFIWENWLKMFDLESSGDADFFDDMPDLYDIIFKNAEHWNPEILLVILEAMDTTYEIESLGKYYPQMQKLGILDKYIAFQLQKEDTEVYCDLITAIDQLHTKSKKAMEKYEQVVQSRQLAKKLMNEVFTSISLVGNSVEVVQYLLDRGRNY